MDALSGTLETPRSEVAVSVRRGSLRRSQRFGVILGGARFCGCRRRHRVPIKTGMRPTSRPLINQLWAGPCQGRKH